MADLAREGHERQEEAGLVEDGMPGQVFRGNVAEESGLQHQGILASEEEDHLGSLAGGSRGRTWRVR